MDVTNYAWRVRVTVLGATGFIGAWAVRALVACGHDVTALARTQSDTWRIDSVPDLRIVRAASTDWPAAFSTLRPEALLSLDWIGVSAADRNDDVQMQNLPRQAELVRAALAAGTTRIVGVGSQAEYGPVEGRTREDRAPSPTTAYGRAKVAASTSLAEACDAADAEWCWARVFSVFGPLETGNWLLPSIARAAAKGDTLELSSGAQPWNYLFAADAGTALSEIISNPAASGTYNVGHPEAPPLRESVELFAVALGAADVPHFGTAPGAPLQADTSRLQGLGWEPAWPAEKALATTAQWFRGEAVTDPFFAHIVLPRDGQLQL